MRIGELRRRLQLQSRQTSLDAEGRPQELWGNVANVWANVRPLTASELLLAQQAGVQVSHEVTVRYRSDLAAVPQPGGVQAGHDLRLVDAGRVLEIHGLVHVQEERRSLRLLCTELEPV